MPYLIIPIITTMITCPDRVYKGTGSTDGSRKRRVDVC